MRYGAYSTLPLPLSMPYTASTTLTAKAPTSLLQLNRSAEVVSTVSVKGSAYIRPF